MMVEMTELVEFEPGRWRVARPAVLLARSDLPCPSIISDIMPETEQVDGRFYTSKSAFRRVGKQLGLIEVGNEKPKAKARPSSQERVKKARREAIGKAVSQYRAGRRVEAHAPKG
jgi:hypothetical protein